MEFIFVVFGFVLLIIVISTVGDTLKAYWKAKGQQASAAARPAEDERELLEKIRRLEERIEVLERIVTDDRYELRRRFKDLG